MARACLFLLEHYDEPEHVNVGVGEDVTIRELGRHWSRGIVGYGGSQWDTSKPDGTPRKLLDVSKIKSSAGRPRSGWRTGIRWTYDWYVNHAAPGWAPG